MSTVDLKTAFAKAKTRLILDHPFFASLLLNMRLVEDASIPTMATDGDNIYFNPAWASKHSLQELVFVFAHEVMHCVFDHMLRIGEKNHNKWNIACDYVINDLLIKERLGTMPHGGLHNPQLVLEGGGTAEGVYKLLPKEDEDKQPGQDGGAMDSLKQPSKDQSVLTQKSAEMRVKVIQAKNAAKMMGKLSAGLERMVDDVSRSEMDWRAVMRRFFSERAKDTLSYARPKRRFLGEDICLPSLQGEKLGTVVIAVDCSGSVQGPELAAFESEVSAIMSETKPALIKVIYFDSEVLNVEEFKEDDFVKLKPVGGGGTAFSPIFEAIDAQDMSPVACVVLTDLYCDDFGHAPTYPVLWASVKRPEGKYGTVPFGEVMVLKAKD
jgi:predicted metal-dependent peptidase